MKEMWCYGLSFVSRRRTRIFLERKASEGDSPVQIILQGLIVSRVPSLGYVVGIWEPSTSNLKYYLSQIANKYREGKLKRTLNRELKDLET